jgi:LacI family transcriptional regulator
MALMRTVALALELDEAWQWHQGIYAGTQRYARESGNWRCVIDEFPQAKVGGRDTGPQRYDGVIARASRQLASWARRNGIPVVNVWRSSPAKGIPSVHADHEEIGRLCAAHLRHRGFRQFGVLWAKESLADKIEMRAFCSAVSNETDTFRDLVLSSDAADTARSWSAQQKRIRDWLSGFDPPAAVFVTQASRARQVVHLCEDLGWDVPRDVAIVCAENEPLLCENPSPSLSSIDYNWERVGYEAARLLDCLMEGEPVPEKPVIVAPAGIVPRGSTEFFAVEDKIVSAALRYISTHLAESFTLGQVANAVATSPRTLQRRFEEHLGHAVSVEVRRLRMELAKRMLADPEHNVAEISWKAGFGPPSRMREVFRRELAMSPSEYRKQRSTGERHVFD